MNRRIINSVALMTAFLCTLTACSSDKKTENTTREEPPETSISETSEPEPSAADRDIVNEYIAANAGGLYWERHDNMWCHLSKYVNEEKQSPMNFYQDDKTFIWFYENGNITCGGHDCFLYILPDGDNIIYRTDLTDRDELYETWYKHIHDRDYIVVNDSFILIETSEKEDGIFEALYEIQDPEACRDLAESEAPDLPEDFVYDDSIRFRYLYRFDANTRDLLGYFHYSVDASGTIRTLAEAEFTYDMEMYDPFAQCEPFYEYRSMQEDPRTSRRITIVFDPDTADENIREFVIPQAAEFGVYYRDDVPVEELYSDRECTVPYTEDTGTGDLELFTRDKSANT